MAGTGSRHVGGQVRGLSTLKFGGAGADLGEDQMRHETRREEKRSEDKRRGREGKRTDEKRREEKTREERQKGEDNSEVVREILPGLIRPGSNTSYNFHFGYRGKTAAAGSSGANA